MRAGSRSAGTIPRFHAHSRSPPKRAGGSSTSTIFAKRSPRSRTRGECRLLHCSVARRWLPSGAMSPHVAPAAARTHWVRPFRYLWRGPMLLLLALVAFPLALAVFNPLADRLKIGGEHPAHVAQRWWSR